jgi:putative DNA primase/helicase
MPHDPVFMCTKMAPARYVPGARHPDWEKALRAIPKSCQDWYWVRCGQGITGHMTPDDKVIIEHGGGENGKTTIALGIKGALGDYYLDVAHRALVGDPRQHPTELTDFQGARFAVLEELPEDGHLSAVRLKMLVGTPYLTARRNRQDDVTFPCTHSLFVNTNHRPILDETTHAAWRRLYLLTYPFRYVEPGKPRNGPYERTGDPGLRDRIRNGYEGQHEAVLEWLVDGARCWYEHDKRMPLVPERVERDTLEWRCDADLILGYINDRIVFDPGYHVAANELFQDASAWLADRRHSAWSQKLLTERFGGHEETRKHRVVKRVIRRFDGQTEVSRRPAAESFHRSLSDPYGDLPGQYTAWIGMRFRMPADDETDQDPQETAGG